MRRPPPASVSSDLLPAPSHRCSLPLPERGAPKPPTLAPPLPSPPPQAAPAELSSAFAGCSPTEVAVFLRLLYSPDQATPGSLAAVHAHAAGLLAGVAGLAHRLDAAGLLVKIEGYLQGGF